MDPSYFPREMIGEISKYLPAEDFGRFTLTSKQMGAFKDVKTLDIDTTDVDIDFALDHRDYRFQSIIIESRKDVKKLSELKYAPVELRLVGLLTKPVIIPSGIQKISICRLKKAIITHKI